MLFETSVFFLNIIALLVGLFTCACFGNLLEEGKGSMSLLEYNTALAFFAILGGSMVGTGGGRLELSTWRIVLKEQTSVPFVGAILLIICGFACVGLGMWLADTTNEKEHPPNPE